MPFINFKFSSKRTKEEKIKLAESVSNETSRILQIPKEWISISFDEYSGENWAFNGKLMCDLNKEKV